MQLALVAICFENFGTKMPGFKLVVQKAWNEASTHSGPCQLVFHKLKKTSQRHHAWSKTIFSNTKVQLHMALEVILRLDMAQQKQKSALCG